MAHVVITGASRGIGMATAVLLARAGHHVVATMRNPSATPELLQLAATEKLPIQIEKMDVTSDASVAECLSRIQSDNPVDVLVNNAGIECLGSVEETPLVAFRQCMETNYFGAIRCIQAVLPGMRHRRGGTIINLSSVAGRISTAPMGPYSASKFALEALSESLAQETRAFGIRVIIVEPGITDTRMARNIEALPASNHYPQSRRIAGLFAAVLSGQPATPEVVAGQIQAIIQNPTWQLRHTASPDAAALLAWRAQMTDEQWTEWGALDDASWVSVVRRDLGLDVRL